MYYIKTENENGDYRDTDGKRYSLYRGTWVAQKDRWTWFDTEEECLDAWGLTFDTASQGYAEAGPIPLPEPDGEAAQQENL